MVKTIFKPILMLIVSLLPLSAWGQEITQWTFNYTGDVQTFTAPVTGSYMLECYGAQGGATHIATSAIGPITSDKDFTSNHTGLLLIAGGGGGGCNKGPGGNGGGAEGEKGSHLEAYWNIAWNNGTHSCGKDGMLSRTETTRIKLGKDALTSKFDGARCSIGSKIPK